MISPFVLYSSAWWRDFWQNGVWKFALLHNPTQEVDDMFFVRDSDVRLYPLMEI